MSEGPVWQRQRRLTQPVFYRERLAAVVPLMTRHVATMRAEWEREVNAGTVDMHAEMMRLTATILGDTVLGVDLTRDVGSLPRTVSAALSGFSESCSSRRCRSGCRLFCLDILSCVRLFLTH